MLPLETVEAVTLSPANLELGLTQSTLSQQVAAIEQRMCETLFKRVGKRQVLTRDTYDRIWLYSLWIFRNQL
jgi:DNA-binding transcriptional LysR family regulator